MKKLLSLILALVMVLSLASAALAEETDKYVLYGQEYGMPLFDEKVTLTIGVPTKANVIDFNTNETTLLYEQLTNTDLEFVVYSTEMNTQLTMAITAGEDLPDILFTSGVSTDLLFQWAQAGAIIPINEYIDTHGYFIKDALDRTGVDFLQMMTSPDGNLYTFPSINQSMQNQCADRIWFYLPWLEKLNLEVPTNAEELYAVLKAFKEQDPNGNGEADEIPLMSHNSKPGGESDAWWSAIMNMFLYVPTNGYSVNDGVVSYTAVSDSYREGLKYIRKLFDEGLIDPMSFTADEAQLRALVNAETPVIGMTVGNDAEVTQWTPEDELWVLASPFYGADGKARTTFHASTPSVNGMITADCENPEAAFRFVDFMYNRDHMVGGQYGVKGLNWEWASNLPELNLEARHYYAGDFEPTYYLMNNIWGTVQNDSWYSAAPFARDITIAAGVAEIITEDYRRNCIVKHNERYMDYFAAYPEDGEYIPMLTYTAEETDLTAMARTDLESYMTTARTAFMLNKDGMDIYSDEAWNAYIEQCKLIGLDLVTETIQTAYDRMYK